MHSILLARYNGSRLVSIQKGYAENMEQMLAVRLPRKLIDAVRDYAATERKPIKKVVEEIIRFGLAQSADGSSKRKQRLDRATRRNLYSQYRQALSRGEVIRSDVKGMLAARLPEDLVDSVKVYSADTEKNVCLIVEEFILLTLEQKERVDSDLRHLTSRLRTPYRNRPIRKTAAK